MWKIWFEMYKDEEMIGAGVSAKDYVRRGNAQRVADTMEAWNGAIKYKCIVSETNPWRSEED